MEGLTYYWNGKQGRERPFPRGMCQLVTFLLVAKYPVKQLEGGRVYCGSQFEGCAFRQGGKASQHLRQLVSTASQL